MAAVSSGRVAVEPEAPAAQKKRLWTIVFPVLLVAALIAGVLYYRSRQTKPLSEKDTIVLADFTNSTGDAVFDDTLKQALSVALNQSPFLNVLSDNKVAATLKMMSRPVNMSVTPDVAREVCQRSGSKAYIAGSIASLGSEYVLGLKAVNCQSGDLLAQEQVTAAAKEKVLDALGGASAKLRGELGESLATVQKFDVPLEQATTSSLEALQAFSVGRKTALQKGDAPAIPLYKGAIELDHSFAVAYVFMGIAYSNLAESGLANENFKKAYDLRERASERERYFISANYYLFVTGEVEKAIQVYETWAQAYPRDYLPPVNLGYIYGGVGRYGEALSETLKTLSLNPDDANVYSNLVFIYAALNRLDEAKAINEQGLARKLENPGLHANRYALAFLEDDAAEMERQVAWAKGKPGAEDLLLSIQSDTEAYFGRLAKARELSRRAAEAARRTDQKETAAQWLLNAALREAELGDPVQTRQQAISALALASTRDLQILAALALARAGDRARAQTIAEELGRNSPANTLLNAYWLPTIRAAIELDRNRSGKAIELLEATSPYQLGQPLPVAQVFGTLYPVYVRGEAYLQARQGQEAAAEFQKIIDHRALIANFVLGALAHLQLGRAYAISGATARARTAYQDFLTLWKDADPDIPILKQAKAEYAKLQ